MKKVLIGLTCLLAVAPLAGCSQSRGPTLEVDSSISLCAPGGPCVLLPAAEAEYIVYRDGEQVAEGTLSRAGRAVIEAGQGTYTVTVRLRDLGVEGSSGEVRQQAGSDAVLGVEVALPSVTVARERSG